MRHPIDVIEAKQQEIADHQRQIDILRGHVTTLQAVLPLLDETVSGVQANLIKPKAVVYTGPVTNAPAGVTSGTANTTGQQIPAELKRWP